MPQYQRLREILAKEKYPHSFMFKFVGRHTTEFETGTEALQKQHPRLVLQSRRQSKGNNHLSFTFVLEARDPEEIVRTFQDISKIPDVLIIL